MLVYHYNADTGVYLNTSSEADEDPMQPGHFLIPANATERLPPSPPDPKKQRAVFSDGAWTVETIPVPPAINKNMKDAPGDHLFKNMSILEVLKGGVSNE
jgi:hypothetical protein